MAGSSRGMAFGAVTAQPHLHLELATLAEMANPKVSVGLGDWPAPPRPPADYGHRSGRREETRGAKQFVVGWGLWTIGMLISECLVGQNSKTRRDFGNSKKTVFESSGSGSSRNNSSNGRKSNIACSEKKKFSDYTLIAAVQVLLGREPGTTTSRRVTFNTVFEVNYVDKCQTLYPPTLEGNEMKRQAFWSKRETEDNQFKWDGHLETYELERNGCGTACECLGCKVDGEETNF